MRVADVTGYDEVLAIWSRGTTCYARHAAKALYVVTGDEFMLPACGDHVSRAINEVCLMASPPLSYVTVWRKP